MLREFDIVLMITLHVEKQNSWQSPAHLQAILVPKFATYCQFRKLDIFASNCFCKIVQITTAANLTNFCTLPTLQENFFAWSYKCCNFARECKQSCTDLQPNLLANTQWSFVQKIERHLKNEPKTTLIATNTEKHKISHPFWQASPQIYKNSNKHPKKKIPFCKYLTCYNQSHTYKQNTTKILHRHTHRHTQIYTNYQKNVILPRKTKKMTILVFGSLY